MLNTIDFFRNYSYQTKSYSYVNLFKYLNFMIHAVILAVKCRLLLFSSLELFYV